MVGGPAIWPGLWPRLPVPLPPLLGRPLRRLEAPVALEGKRQGRVALEGNVDRVALLAGTSNAYTAQQRYTARLLLETRLPLLTELA